MVRLRLLAYNVHGFRAGVPAVARTVAGERPDLAFLNEARGRRRVRRFGSLLGMEAVSALGPLSGVPNAVLLRSPWRASAVRRVRFSRRGLIPRGALVVRAGAGGAAVTAVAVHLGLSDAERLRHARELADVVAGLAEPWVVGGDLNEGPHGEAATWLAARLTDAHVVAGRGPGATYPAGDPRVRIDYLFVSKGVRVERCWVAAGAEASDHLPVLAEVVVGR